MKNLLAATLALALFTYPVEAAQKRKPDVNNYLATCVLSLIVIGLPFGCAKARIGAKNKGKAQVTIHKPAGRTCANGNTYRILRVNDPRHVCKNSLKGGHYYRACTNMSGQNGNAHSLIIVNKAGAHLAHEIHHACDVNWTH